jgi:hypothetical protein
LNYIIILISLLIGISRYLVARNTVTNFDTYGHLYIIKELKNQNQGIFGKILLRIIGNNGLSYPFLFYWVISKFKFDRLLKWHSLFNPTLDFIFSLFIALTLFYLDFNFKEIIIGLLVYGFTPLYFSRLSLGPRTSSFTPRLFSEIISNIFFVITVTPIFNTVTAIILGAVFCFISISSSKFSVQALLFLTPIISIFSQNSVPMIALVLGLIIAVIISKGEIFNTLIDQYQFLKTYYINNNKNKMQVSNRNNIFDFYSKNIKMNKKKNFNRWVMYFLNRNSFTCVLFKNPILFMIIIFLINNRLGYNNLLIPKYLLFPVLAGIFLFVIINWRPLLFLGEAERYLNHILIFQIAIMLFILESFDNYSLVYYLLSYGFVFWIIETQYLHKVEPIYQKKEIDNKIIKALIKMPDRNILLYPYHAIGVFRILLQTNHKVFYHLLTSKDFQHKFNQEYTPNYPCVNIKQLDQMGKDYNINLVIIDKKRLELNNLNKWFPSKEWHYSDVGNPDYLIYTKD